MQLPPGVMDPLFLFELAESQNKSVRELTTGEPGMSAHELCVLWPLYHDFKRREAARQEQSQQNKPQRTLG